MKPGLDIDARKLMKQLNRLGPKVEGVVSRKAVTAGGLPLLKAMQAEVPVEEGTLENSLGRKSKLYKQSGTAVAMIGPRVKGSHLGYHGHLIENGHINVDGSFTPGSPFMAPAQQSAGPAAIQRMTAKLAAEITKEAGKL